MRMRTPRTLAAIVAGLMLVPIGTALTATPSAANIPARQTGEINCVLNANGRARVSWVAPLTGDATFTAFPAMVIGSNGAEAEVVTGAGFAKVVANTSYAIDIESDFGTCTLGWAVDTVPTNDTITAAEPLMEGPRGSAFGTTRAATLGAVDDDAPTPRTLRTVWYRWTGRDGPVTFTATPQRLGGLLDAGHSMTSVGVAIYDAANPTTPLQVGGDGVAPQEGEGTSGSASITATSGQQYLIAVFSADGSGTMANQFGYLPAGRFTLAWTAGNTTPVAGNDVVETPVDTPVQIAVLANDSDAEGDGLFIRTFDSNTLEGGEVEFEPLLQQELIYTPAPGFTGVDHFTYEADDDGIGAAATGAVSVYVGVPAARPALTVTPETIDLGAVPLGNVAESLVTITNTGTEIHGPRDITLTQAAPMPWDAERSCLSNALFPGESCTQRVRFWSVPNGGDASPATLTVHDAEFDITETVTLVATTAPPVPPETPNTPPVALDESGGMDGGTTFVLSPLDNDSDPDGDAIRLTHTVDPPHGTIGPIRPCADLIPEPLVSAQTTCVAYTPDPGFRGMDVVHYTIEDSRGAVATGKYFIGVDNPPLRVDTVSPRQGAEAGGQTITVTGANFAASALVEFTCNGVSFMHLTDVQSPTQLTFTRRPLPPGPCDITVHVHFLTPFRAPGGSYLVADNRPPVANDDNVTVRQTTTASIPVLANDSDPDGDAIHVISTTQPPHGRLDAFAPDVYEYTPAAGYVGADAFTYTIVDDDGATATATVHVDVIGGVGTVRANVTFADGGLAVGELACVQLSDAAGPVGEQRCVTAADPTAVFTNVPLGSYTVGAGFAPGMPTTPRLPHRYVEPAPVPATVAGDGVTEIVSLAVPVRELRVTALDDNGAAVGPVCYRLTARDGAPRQPLRRARRPCSVHTSPGSPTSGVASAMSSTSRARPRVWSPHPARTSSGPSTRRHQCTARRCA